MDDSVGRKGVTRPVRVEDVAREAGVSPITVSRALSVPDKVRPETRRKVAEAVARTGYVVNSIASSLRSGRSSIVTVFVSSLRNPHSAAAIQGVIDVFEGTRYRLMFAQTGYSEQLGPEFVTSSMPFRPAAVIVTGLVRDEATRQSIRGLDVPVLELWGDRPDPIDMLVRTSAFDGGRLMGTHFGKNGHRHIAYSGPTNFGGAPRLEGFREGLAAFGVSPELVLSREGDGAFADGLKAFDEILDQLPQCDAIFFGGDLLAVGGIIAARRRNVDVPGQVAVAGYGDLDFAMHVDPPITTVHVSDYEMGRIGGEMLLTRLEGGKVAEPVIQVPLQLLKRGSSAPTGAKKSY